MAEALDKLSACEAAAAAARGELGDTKAALAQLASQHQSLVHLLAKRPDSCMKIVRYILLWPCRGRPHVMQRA